MLYYLGALKCVEHDVNIYFTYKYMLWVEWVKILIADKHRIIFVHFYNNRTIDLLVFIQFDAIYLLWTNIDEVCLQPFLFVILFSNETRLCLKTATGHLYVYYYKDK